jgi:hypothetical protein
MPNYSSKSQSKSGGRRKKQTKRKLRRGRKSRKVMRGGAVYTEASQLNTLFEGKDALKTQLLGAYNVTDFKGMMALNDGQFNTNRIAYELGEKGYDANSELVKLLRSVI